MPCHETISWWYVNKDFALAMLRSTLLAARDPQIRPAVLRNALLVAQHGAGAKKCWGPAPLIIINILKVRNLSFYGGAGNHKKSAPAPSENHVEVKLMLSIGNRSIYVSVHVLMGFRGVNVIPVPFTPRFGVFSWFFVNFRAKQIG